MNIEESERRFLLSCLKLCTCETVGSQDYSTTLSVSYWYGVSESIVSQPVTVCVCPSWLHSLPKTTKGSKEGASAERPFAGAKEPKRVDQAEHATCV